jgi:uncharacterized membrane protein
MEYTEAALSKLKQKKGFRLRGLEMTRLETFMDAAFAFAITMLVISIDKIPGNYAELTTALKGMPAFAFSFALMMTFWISHRKWSRFYGLEDGSSIFFSLLLIFVLLVYIYPLKLMFSAFCSWATGGWLPSEFHLQNTAELISLFIIYGLGFAAMGSLMALLYWKARIQKERLNLNAVELLHTNQEIVSWVTMGLTGLSSALFAIIMPAKIAIFSGFIYTTLSFTTPYQSIKFAKNLAKLQSK